MALSKQHRCPQCHGIMEQGYLPTSGGMQWLRRRDASSVDFPEPVPGTHTWLRRARLPAWRCKKCQLIAFRYGQGVAHDPDQPEEQEMSDEEAGLSGSAEAHEGSDD